MVDLFTQNTLIFRSERIPFVLGILREIKRNTLLHSRCESVRGYVCMTSVCRHGVLLCQLLECCKDGVGSLLHFFSWEGFLFC